MFRSRLISFLLGLTLFLLIAAGIFFYLQVPRRQNPFAGALDKADRLVLAQGAEKVELSRKNKDWKVKSPQGDLFPEGDKVKTLLSGLHDVQIEDEISTRSDRAAAYEVNLESGTRVSLFVKDTLLADGLFGKQAPDFTHLYFRYPDKPSVFLARGIIRGELGGTTVNAWRSHELLSVPESKVQSVLIEGKGFKTSLTRSSDTWTLNGEKIDSATVDRYVGVLAHLRADDFVDPAREPTIPLDGLTFARIQVNSGSDAFELHIGPENPTTHRYPAATSKDGAMAWIPEGLVKMLVRKPADFRSPPK